MELPITFETIRGRDLARAIEGAERTGDMGPVWKIVDHVAAESGLSQDTMLAIVLFKLAVDAGEAGDIATRDRYLQDIARWCSRDAVENATLGGMLGSARKQGWLPGPVYDQLADRVEQLPADHLAHELFAGIERRE